jgi:hypothetical protein
MGNEPSIYILHVGDLGGVGHGSSMHHTVMHGFAHAFAVRRV